MSTTAIDVHDFTTHDARAKPAFGAGFFARLIEARTRHAESRVRHFLAAKADADLARLGFTADEIKVIRLTGKVPHRRAR